MDLESVLPSAELSSAGSAARAFAVVDEQKRAPLPTDLELHAADAACTMRPARTRRVYVLQGVNGGFYHEFITFVNEPVLLTIANGVRAYEAQRATGGASWTVHVRTNFSAIGVQRLLAVPGALCAKDVLVWVGHLSRLEQQMPWNQLRARAVHTASLDLLVLGLVAGQVGGGAGRGEGAGQREDDHALALEDVRRRHVLPLAGVVAADLRGCARARAFAPPR